jgi:diguanylate cyclase (GGDEF)-like protein
MPRRSTFGGLTDRLSSFRTRLRLFFVLIVILPMVAVTFVVFHLIADSARGQADARIAAREEAAISVYYDARARADRLAARIGRDPQLATALRSGDRAAIAAAAERLRTKTHAARIVLTRNGRSLADVGDQRASFPAIRSLVANGRSVADLEVSVLTAPEYALLLQRITGLDVVVRSGDRTLATTIPAINGARLPRTTGRTEIAGEAYRAASFNAPGFSGQRLAVSLLEPQAATDEDIRRGRLLAGLILAGFFLLALVSATVVSRALNRQIESFLAAAQRLGGGDFSAKVPTTGNDQFAQLGEEFNKMSDQLASRVEQLAQERVRLEQSLRRIGETFASNLDRDALLEIVVRTAVDAVEAAGGHALVRAEDTGELEQVAHVGAAVDGAARAADVAEQQVLADGEPAYADEDDGHALTHPLHAGPADPEGPERVTGVISVWRQGRPFERRERELFHYLAGQAAVSIENVNLHETVERQAITDELTGLSNRRRFQETMAAEVERSRRFGQELGLVLLDIDDFKSVNDTYGHQQGDLVLREIAKVLRASSREIDEPARYGGEELAVILPGTNLEGAFELAERVREGIENLRLPILGDDGAEPLRVTASLGAASLPEAGSDARTLVAAADEALYQAKRGGKNQTRRAG